MVLVHNEQIKLTATWFNTLATACITVGVLAPIATALYGFGANPISTVALVMGLRLGFLLA